MASSQAVDQRPVGYTKVAPSSGASSGGRQIGYTKTAGGSAPSSTPSSSSSTNEVDAAGFKISGLINIATSQYSSECGAPNAQDDSDDTTGPNGSIEWLNCGISKSNPTSQWNAPTLKIEDIIVKDLDANGIFAPCAKFFDLFEKYGKQYTIPAIYLASFAMQESTCDPNATGDNGGAFGLVSRLL